MSPQNPLAFVPAGEASKHSLLSTFARERQFYAGAVDSDAERALKSRVNNDCGVGQSTARVGTDVATALDVIRLAVERETETETPAGRAMERARERRENEREKGRGDWS